ncbi:hypothetical protein E2C01_077981 [Portunus trituberculatus]|uniref:Uncharacterized protein n=1 Tax=Portunus trituberculatus TaxID=210409 RepID=A0A5B7ISW7_PORTR|nr:hypothetical protein [Portunus trituberculatus]
MLQIHPQFFPAFVHLLVTPHKHHTFIYWLGKETVHSSKTVSSLTDELASNHKETMPSRWTPSEQSSTFPFDNQCCPGHELPGKISGRRRRRRYSGWW